MTDRPDKFPGVLADREDASGLAPSVQVAPGSQESAPGTPWGAMGLTPIQYFDHYTTKDPVTGCWNWTRAKTLGYGRLAIKRKTKLAHRIAYQEIVGPIPDGLTLDHMCRNPSCVNPAHLEPKTLAENSRRNFNFLKTHCVNGHLFDEKNTYRLGRHRYCRKCNLINHTKRKRDGRNNV